MNSKNKRPIGTLTALIAAGGLLLSACDSRTDGDSGNEESDVADTGSPEDPFIWLEEVEGERALAWAREQNQRSLESLENDPRFEPIRQAALKIYNAPDRIPYGLLAGDYVYNFWQDDQHVRGIWRRTNLEGYRADEPDWDVLIDLDALAENEGENWVWKGADCAVPGFDLCIISLSRGGGDAVVLREFDTEQKAFVENGFNVDEGKQWTAWADRDSLMIATDFGEDSMNTSGYPRQVRMWQRGTPLADAQLVFESEPDDAFALPIAVHRSDGHHLFVYRAPDFFSEDIYAVSDAGQTQKLALPEDVNFQGVYQGHAVALLRSDWQLGDDRSIARGSVVAVPLEAIKAGDTSGVATIVTPTDRVAVEQVALGGTELYVTLLDDVKGRLVAARLADGAWSLRDVDMPANGSVSIVSSGEQLDATLVNYESFLQPDTLYLLPGGGEPDAIKSTPQRFDASGYTTEQLFATSKDGARIPYFVVRAADLVADGSNPTLLYGYGGFEISLTPGYLAPLAIEWLKRGGVYVVANIRGGGEYGPEWHQAALKENRQRAFDDFQAVAEDLISRNITSPDHLGIRGGSNGGLLTAVALTQRPDLFNAVIVAVPLADMMRYHKLLAGASWIGEYGNPDIPEERAYIARYSPYQNLKPEADYPEAFFYTSTKDDRVHPGHARKMVARMMRQGHEVLYYENIEGGHSAAANLKQRAYTTGLETVYLLQRLKDR